MTDDSIQNALMTLAFSVHSNPGAYALLIGSGVSAPSGIPTAWGVREELARRVALVDGEDLGTITDPIAWYQRRYGGDAEYQELLEKLAPTQIERKNLLQGFFEPTPEDVQAGRKKPTAAHHAIAQLALSGHIRVILTLNFDHLIEQALREAGISPVVLATPADFEGREPLHTQGVRVIHLHGEYLNPTSMLNTNDELGHYTPATQEILENVIRDYGLIIAGWSATYDPELREAIARHYPIRYTMAWIAPHGLTQDAERLRINKRGLALTTSADDAFGRLNDAVTALHTRQARHHLTVPAAIETAKRDLMGANVAIGVHDTFKAALDELHRNEYLDPTRYSEFENTVPYPDALAVLEEKSSMAVALTAVLAYWGSEETERWWLHQIPRLATVPVVEGSPWWAELRRLPAGAMFYAAGISLVAAERWSPLRKLFALSGVEQHGQGTVPLGYTLDSFRIYGRASAYQRRLYDWLYPILKDALTLSEPELEDAWQLFELFRLGNNLRLHWNYDARLDRVTELRRQLEVGAGTTLIDSDKVKADLELARAEMGDAAGIYAPHLFTRASTLTRFTTPTADQFVQELGANQLHAETSLSRVFNTDATTLVEIFRSLSAAAGAEGRKLALNTRQGVGLHPIWLDEGPNTQ